MPSNLAYGFCVPTNSVRLSHFSQLLRWSRRFSLHCHPNILWTVQNTKHFNTFRSQFLRSSMCALPILWEERLHTRKKRVKLHLQYDYINQRIMVFSSLVRSTVLACAAWLLVFLFCQQRDGYVPHMFLQQSTKYLLHLSKSVKLKVFQKSRAGKLIVIKVWYLEVLLAFVCTEIKSQKKIPRKVK
jgi:hypothetical protein